MLKGPKRSFVVVDVLAVLVRVGGNHEQKMFQIEQNFCKGTKNVLGNKKIPIGQNEVHEVLIVIFCGTLWY